MTDEIQIACVELFAKMHGEMTRLSPKLRSGAKQMLAIMHDGCTSKDEKRAALHTLVETFFPGPAEDLLTGQLVFPKPIFTTTNRMGRLGRKNIRMSNEALERAARRQINKLLRRRK